MVGQRSQARPTDLLILVSPRGWPVNAARLQRRLKRQVGYAVDPLLGLARAPNKEQLVDYRWKRKMLRNDDYPRAFLMSDELAGSRRRSENTMIRLRSASAWNRTRTT